MGFFRGSLVDGGYEPSTIHKILKPKVKGNDINGLGQRAMRRPTPIYHWFGRLKVPFNWSSLVLLYGAIADKRSRAHMKKSRYYENKAHSPVAGKPVEKSPREWSAAIKEFVLANGADLVGISPMREEWVFEGFDIPEKWIIMLGFKMDYAVLSTAPEVESGNEVLRVYAHGQETAWRTADWLRIRGWAARGYCGPMASPVNMLPAALAAGFGELGKHGSIINRQLGSNLRLAYVLTDIPLVEDKPDEFGADDFCTRCQVCTRACPPQAIFPSKQLVRGTEKWYVDFDKCLPYFNDYAGCGICIAVCPWSRPGVAESLAGKLARRAARKRDRCMP